MNILTKQVGASVNAPNLMRKLTLTVQGHKVNLLFAEAENPTITALIKKTLLDSYMQKEASDIA